MNPTDSHSTGGSPKERSADSASTLHPHDLAEPVPDRLPNSVIRQLSALKPHKVLIDLGQEWIGIAGAVAAYLATENPFVYVLAVLFIGARQQALTVLAHDASHMRFMRNRALGDWVANLTMNWPVFINAAGFRKFHGQHHRFLDKKDDGNRRLWGTHNKQGELTREWTYPKSKGQLLVKLLRRTLFVSGLKWIVRGFIATFLIRHSIGQKATHLAFYAALAALFTYTGLWLEFFMFWIVPMCTWHMTIQYMRLIAEHSAVTSDDPAYAQTRTTIPTFLEKLFILPRNIGYHIEHHWYPSVPYYNLPALHDQLMENPAFARSACISYSIMASMKAVTQPIIDLDNNPFVVNKK